MIAVGKRRIEYPSRSPEFKIWNIADSHLGTKASEKDRLRADIDEIKNDPYSFWVCTGDYGEFISIRDRKRFDANFLDQEIFSICDIQNMGRVLIEYVRDMFAPIADKCIGIGYGNHERKYMLEQEQEGLHGWLVKELNTVSIGYSAMMNLVFVRKPGIRKPRIAHTAEQGNVSNSFRVLCHHGSGGSNTQGSKQSRLEKFVQMTNADMIFVGHCHGKHVCPLHYLTTNKDGTKIIEKKRLGIMTGSYLRTYGPGAPSYGEIAGYGIVPLGAVYIAVKPETHEMEAVVRA